MVHTPEPKIEVINKHHGNPGGLAPVVNIGRPSVLGNRYSHLPHANAIQVTDRATAVRLYRDWLMAEIRADNVQVKDALNDIYTKSLSSYGVRLACYCKPSACHGDVIRELIIDLHRGIQIMKG